MENWALKVVIQMLRGCTLQENDVC